MNILFLDTETTGLDPKKNAVIQIAAEFYRDGALVASFNKKSPGAAHGSTINLGALKVNRTKMRDIMSEYQSESGLAQEFVDFLLGLESKEQIVVCGENVNFDLGFIKEMFGRCNIEGLDSLVSYRVQDTAVLSMFLKEAGVLKTEKLGLTHVAKALGLASENEQGFHDAAFDTKMTAKVYFRMLELVKDLNIIVNSR